MEKARSARTRGDKTAAGRGAKPGEGRRATGDGGRGERRRLAATRLGVLCPLYRSCDDTSLHKVSE